MVEPLNDIRLFSDAADVYSNPEVARKEAAEKQNKTKKPTSFEIKSPACSLTDTNVEK